VGINGIVDWMQQTQDTVQWLAVLDTTVNVSVAVKVPDFRLFRKKNTLVLEGNFLCLKLYLVYTEICPSHFGYIYILYIYIYIIGRFYEI
jgi:hypothetical protein